MAPDSGHPAAGAGADTFPPPEAVPSLPEWTADLMWARLDAATAGALPPRGGHRLPRVIGDQPRLDELGFHAEDIEAFIAAAKSLTSEHVRAALAAAGRIQGLLGRVHEQPPAGALADWPDQAGLPRGMVPLVALVITLPELVRYHGFFGIPRDVALSGPQDVAQQVRVHRRTFGEFGLHTQWWCTVTWSGALIWLGRLQFNLRTYAGRWWLSTHIPATGPLVDVEESFARARSFAEQYWPQVPVAGFHCDSWLLDPQLDAALAGRGNIVAFQRRWSLDDEARAADAEALFFVFNTRAEIPAADLPRRSSLERAIADHLLAGGHWYARTGIIEFTGHGSDRSPR